VLGPATNHDGYIPVWTGANAKTLADGIDPTNLKIKTCEIVIGDPGSGSAALADDDDSPHVCTNDGTAALTITAVHCFAPTGSPIVTPIITGGAATSILSGALTCSSSDAAGSPRSAGSRNRACGLDQV